MKSVLGAIMLCSLGTAALTDEVWTTPEGRVVYLDDMSTTAIWGINTAEGATRFYIPGLAGNFESRAVHDGYWIAEGDQGCAGRLSGPDGFQGAEWGRLTLVFHAEGFPSDWTLLLGRCFDAPDRVIKGKSPLTP